MDTPRPKWHHWHAYALAIVFIAPLLYILCDLTAHDSGTALTGEMLLGNWNATPYVASGRADNHSFFHDGRYRFGFNEMNPLDRNVSLNGTWALFDDELVITIASRTDLVGGTISRNEWESFIDGGEYVTSAIDPPMVSRYSAGDLAFCEGIPRDDLFPYPGMGQGKPAFSIKIDGEEYWKLDNDACA